MTKTPTKELFTIYEEHWKLHHEGCCMFNGADGKVAQKLWAQCKRERPDDPMGFFIQRCTAIWEQFWATPWIKNFRGLASVWNPAAAKPKQGGTSWRNR